MSIDLPVRLRRLRQTEAMRAMLTETTLAPANLIAPLFVHDGANAEPIESMPGVERMTLDGLVAKVLKLRELGVRGVAIFPKVGDEKKSSRGEEALNPHSLAIRAIRRIKTEAPDMLVIADIALDPYTTHGHDGVLTADRADVDNDTTVAILAKMAVITAEAGADFVAPSDMMDGRVAVIRAALDKAGHTRAGILAYSAKFASAAYGPFRDAVGSARKPGDKSISKATYQLNPANRREALREAQHDEDEGADMIMVKPAGDYLDIIRDIRENCSAPIAAYQVSGEYARIQAAARLGWLDLRASRDESLLAIRRAGADLILTYFAEAWAEDVKAGR
jgi:porphobilinogen synthase